MWNTLNQHYLQTHMLLPSHTHCSHVWVGLVRLQPDFRIQIKWWVVLFVCVCVCVSAHNKNTISVHCEFGYFVLQSLVICSEFINTSSALSLDPTEGLERPRPFRIQTPTQAHPCTCVCVSARVCACMCAYVCVCALHARVCVHVCV